MQPIPDQITSVNHLVSVPVVAWDAEAPPQTLTYSLDLGAPVGATLDPVSGWFTWTPLLAQAPGSYPITVRVTDNGVPPLSATETFVVTLSVPLRITAQPVSRRVTEGFSINFRVTASGSAPLSYQWWKDAQPFPGATAANLKLPSVRTNDAGAYSVVVSNPGGSVTSSVATLTVLLSPAITVQPASQTVPEGASLSLSVTATGTEPLNYQWFKDGLLLSGTTGNVLSLPQVRTNDAGSYWVMVSGAGDSVISATATVRVQYQRDHVFANTNLIALPDLSLAVPYPSGIVVSNLDGTLTKVTVILSNLTHTWAQDVDALVVGPQGQAVLCMSDAGRGAALGQTLTFDDSAAGLLPQFDVLVSGTYQPTAYSTNQVLPVPAPAGPYSPRLAAFNGTAPNGTWSLYAQDDVFKDSGWVANGWSLVLRTQNVTDDLSLTLLRFGLPVPLASGQFQVTITGAPGQILDILASPDLVRWATNLTLTNVTGSVMFTNNPGVMPYQFYRVRQQ